MTFINWESCSFYRQWFGVISVEITPHNNFTLTLLAKWTQSSCSESPETLITGSLLSAWKSTRGGDCIDSVDIHRAIFCENTNLYGFQSEKTVSKHCRDKILTSGRILSQDVWSDNSPTAVHSDILLSPDSGDNILYFEHIVHDSRLAVAKNFLQENSQDETTLQSPQLWPQSEDHGESSQ